MISKKEDLDQILLSAHNDCLRELNGDLGNKSGTLYHYTDLPGGIAILEHSTLRFTDIRYCNDPAEIKEGLRILKELHNELFPDYLKKSPNFAYIMSALIHTISISASFDSQDDALLADAKKDIQKCGRDPEKFIYPKASIFIACFSESADDLRQWMPYADDGRGVALGFKGVNQHHNLTADQDLPIVKVCYKDQTDKKKYVRNFYQKAYEIFQQTDESLLRHFFGALHMAIIHDVIACKSESYKDEREWRLIWLNGRDAFNKEIQFRTSNNIVRPYMNVSLVKDSVLEVVLGPKMEKELNTHAFQQLFSKAGYKSAEIKQSQIAYR